MESVYINIHFKNYIQHEFELLFDNDNSNWWGRGDKNFWSRRLVLRGTASLENDPYKQIYYAVKYDRKDLKAYVEFKIKNIYDGENFDELLDELQKQCPDCEKFQWKDERTLRWHNVVYGWEDTKRALFEIINYTKEPIEKYFKKEKIDGQFEKCPVNLSNSQEEVSLEIPTAIVIASKYYDVQYLIQDTFMNENMRVYTSSDVQGVELGGALKNIIAFCAGITAELNLGDNTFAALITRGLTEISRLGVAMGGEHNSFYGLSGLGDLIVTCLSEHSRNRKAGRCIGRGLTLEETKKEVGMTIESVDNIEVAHELAQKYNIEMPIVETVYDVLYNGLQPKEAVLKLMTREKKCE